MSSQTHPIPLLTRDAKGNIVVVDSQYTTNNKNIKFKKKKDPWIHLHEAMKDKKLKEKRKIKRQFETQGPDMLSGLLRKLIKPEDFEVFKTEGISDVINALFSVPERCSTAVDAMHSGAAAMSNIAQALGAVEDLPGCFENASQAAAKYVREGVQVGHIFKIDPMYEAVITMVVFCWAYGRDDVPSKVLTVCSAIYVLYIASKNPTISLKIVQFLTSIADHIGILSTAGRMARETDKYNTQGPSVHNALGVAGSLIMLVSSCMNYNLDPDVGLFEKFVTISAATARNISSGRNSISPAMNILIFFQELVNLIPTLFGMDWRANFTGEYWAELDKQKDEYLQLKKKFLDREDLVNVSRRVDSLLAAVEKTSVKRSSGLYAQHRDLKNALNHLSIELKGFGARGYGERAEPFVIVISGLPGIGKSYVSKTIQMFFARKLLSPSAFEDFVAGRIGALVWAPNLVEGFDSNYKNQPFVLVDDMGFSTDASRVTTPKFIAWVGQNPLQTNQAALEDKGNILFDSKLITCTTNILDFARADQTLTSPDALCRRLHYCLHVSIKEEWALDDGTLDIKRAMKESGGEMDSCYWLNFAKFNPYDGTKIDFPKEMRACDIIQEMSDMYDFRHKIHDDRTLQSRVFGNRLAKISGDLAANLPSILKEPEFKTQGLFRCNPACVSCNKLTVEDIDVNIRAIERKLDSIICDCCGRMVERAVPGEHYPEGGCLAKDVQKYDGSKVKLNPNCTYEYYAYARACKHNVASEIKITTMFTWITDKFCDFVVEIYGKIKDIFGESWHVIMGAITFAGAAGLLWNLYSKTDTEDEQFHIRTQARDDNAAQLRKKLVNHNVAWAFAGTGERIGAMLSVGGEILLMNRHTYMTVELHKIERVLIKRYSVLKDPYTFDVSGATFCDPNNVHYFVDVDLVAIRIPKYSAMSIVSSFADEKLSWSQAKTRNVGLAFWEPVQGNQSEFVTLHGTARGFKPIESTDPLNNRYVTRNVVEYNFPTYNGLCCAPIVLDDPKIDSKIVGVHIAGSDTSRKGYGAVVTRQMLEEAMNYFKPLLPQVNCNQMIREKVDYDTLPVKPVQDAEVIGSCKFVKPNYKSELCRSPLFKNIKDVPPNKFPAILNPKFIDGKIVDPVELNITEYSRGSIEPILELFRGAELSYLAMLKKYCKDPGYVDEVTFEEAVMGDKYKVPNLIAMNRATSAGFPDSSYFSDKKRSIFGTEEFLFDSEECRFLKEAVEEMHGHLDGGPIDVISAVFPKDELRPAEKIKNLKTRLIMASSVSTSILTRMQFASYIDWFMDPDNRLLNWSAVGIDMASEGDVLSYVNYHHAGDPNYRVFAGDFSGFDKRLSAWWMDSTWGVFDMYMRPYRSVEQMRRARNMYYSNTHPKMQVNNSLIQWSNSNPSGWVLTTPLNTNANSGVVHYVIPYIVLGPSALEAEVSKFWKVCHSKGYVRATTFGDDQILSVIKGTHDGFDFDKITYSSLSEAYATIGLVYTDEMKSTDFNEGDRTIFDVTFLKRRVRRSEIGLVACLDVETIVQNIQWRKVSDNDLELWHDKLENFLNELSIHPDDVWDYYYPRLKDAYEQHVEEQQFSFEPTKLERMRRWRTSSLLLQ